MIILGVAVVLTATPAAAYIGPGAGFALGGSLLFALLGLLTALVGLVTWPFRLTIRLIRHRKVRARARCAAWWSSASTVSTPI